MYPNLNVKKSFALLVFFIVLVGIANYTNLFAKKFEKLAESDIITASCQEKMPGREELNKFLYGEALLRVPTP